MVPESPSKRQAAGKGTNGPTAENSELRSRGWNQLSAFLFQLLLVPLLQEQSWYFSSTRLYQPKSCINFRLLDSRAGKIKVHVKKVLVQLNKNLCLVSIVAIYAFPGFPFAVRFSAEISLYLVNFNFSLRELVVLISGNLKWYIDCTYKSFYNTVYQCLHININLFSMSPLLSQNSLFLYLHDQN